MSWWKRHSGFLSLDRERFTEVETPHCSLTIELCDKLEPSELIRVSRMGFEFKLN